MAQTTVGASDYDTDNSTHNYSYWNGSYYDYQDANTLFSVILYQRVVPVIFGIILVVGLTGNSLAIYVILSRKAMRTITNFLLLNLAFADIAFLSITVPFTAYKYGATSWPFGDFTCKLFKYSLYVCVFVTIWTLVAISAYRLMAVVFSLGTHKYRTKRNVIILNVTIWCIMLLCHIPTLQIHRQKSLKLDNETTLTYCGVETDQIYILFVSFFVFGYFTPLILIILMYFGILLYLKRSGNTTIDNANAAARTARACRLIVIVVVVFGLSWLPYHLNAFLAYYELLPNSNPTYEVLRVLWNCFGYANSCANPFIYNATSADFRKAFREIFACHRKSNRGSGENGTTTERVKMVAV